MCAVVKGGAQPLPAWQGRGSPTDQEDPVRITYDTVTDSISSPELTAEQSLQLQHELSAALGRNDPIRTVAGVILARAKQLDAEG